MNDGDLIFNYLEDDRDDYKNKYPRHSYITNCLLLVTIVSQPKLYCDELLHHLNINTYSSTHFGLLHPHILEVEHLYLAIASYMHVADKSFMNTNKVLYFLINP